MNYERLFLDNLPVLDGVVRYIAVRYRLSPDEADELGAAIRLKIVENDYEVLRKFERRCSIRTYLTTVTQRHFLDSQNSRWGKWRPSAQARRLGPAAVLLDQLITRDGLPFDEASRKVRSRFATLSDGDVRAMMNQLPARPRRLFVGEEALAQLTNPTGGDDLIESLDAPTQAARIEQALGSALSRLDRQDRLILRMRFCDDLQIATISRLLSLPQKPLYGRLQHIMKVLRAELEAAGVSRADLPNLVEGRLLDNTLSDATSENGAGRPSI